MIKREIPKNIEAEEAVLGSILINQETIYGVSELLDIEDFYRKSHRTIFKANAVFPILGRAAKIIKSEFFKPCKKLSRSCKPVSNPNNSPL